MGGDGISFFLKNTLVAELTETENRRVAARAEVWGKWVIVVKAYKFPVTR